MLRRGIQEERKNTKGGRLTVRKRILGTKGILEKTRLFSSGMSTY